MLPMTTIVVKVRPERARVIIFHIINRERLDAFGRRLALRGVALREQCDGQRRGWHVAGAFEFSPATLAASCCWMT